MVAANGKPTMPITLQQLTQTLKFRSIARRHGVSIETVNLIASATLQHFETADKALWNIVLRAHEFQAEGIKKWAEILSDLSGKSERRLFEYALAGRLFGDIPEPERLRYGFSCWILFAGYAKYENSDEVWNMWNAEAVQAGHAPKYERLRDMLYATFGETPSHAHVRRVITSLQKRIATLLTTTNGDLPEDARLLVCVAGRALVKAGKKMDVFNPGVLIETLNASECDEPLTSGARGAIVGLLDVLFKGKPNRIAFLNWAYGIQESSSELTPRQWHGIKSWLGLNKIDGRWVINPNAHTDATNWLAWREQVIADELRGAG